MWGRCLSITAEVAHDQWATSIYLPSRELIPTQSTRDVEMFPCELIYSHKVLSSIQGVELWCETCVKECRNGDAWRHKKQRPQEVRKWAESRISWAEWESHVYFSAESLIGDHSGKKEMLNVVLVSTKVVPFTLPLALFSQTPHIPCKSTLRSRT